MDKSEFGFLAEFYVAQYLKGKGYQLLDHNYRKPWGELDLVMQKDGVLVFIEVKANKVMLKGFEPELRASHDKMVKVHRTARTYLAEKRYKPDQEWQIDVVSFTFNKYKEVGEIKHFKNIEI